MDEYDAAMALPEVIAAKRVKDNAWRDLQYELQQAENLIARLQACYKSAERDYFKTLPWNK